MTKLIFNDTEEKVIAFGCGVNSVAMVSHLFEKGLRYPIVFADTGSEQPETYEYLPYFREFLLKTYKSEITVLSPGTHPELYEKRIREFPYYSLEDYCIGHGRVPTKSPRFCTSDWKIRPMERWGKKNGYNTHLIGIASDEKHRAKSFCGQDNRFPLIEAKIDREGCIEIIKAAGLEPPKKSGCWFCPFQPVREWNRLYDQNPDLWERAVEMEKNASEQAGRKVKITGGEIRLEEYPARWKRKGTKLFPDVHRYEKESCYMCEIG